MHLNKIVKKAVPGLNGTEKEETGQTKTRYDRM